ncbi:MAG: glycosyltransferase [Planctomycetia bacterium]|nr:glycosyltransferase [Planctomycetia bacterium]
MTAPSRKSLLMVTRGLDPVGTGRQVELAAEAFRDAGWSVAVAVGSSGGAVPARLAARGFAVHMIGRRPESDVAAVLRLARLGRRLRPAVVEGWGREAAGVVAAARPAFAATRAVAHVATGPRSRSSGWALTRLDRVITTSAGVAGRCEAVGVRSGLIDIIPPGVFPAEPAGLDRSEVARRLGLRPETQWTLAVASLTSAARLERLLWAIDQLAVVHRGVEHVLVGRGPLLGRVLRRARVQQLAERLRVVPHCDCLPDLVRECQLVWQSGDVAYGGAILDALACGIPAVAVTSDAARQIVADGETGRIVPADPESEFPRRAFNVLEDRELAARYAAAARIRADEHFPPGPALARHIEAVERLVTR